MERAKVNRRDERVINDLEREVSRVYAQSNNNLESNFLTHPFAPLKLFRSAPKTS